jgi:hypothetical protein
MNSQESGAVGGAMKRISTKYSFSIKLFPFVFFGFLAFFFYLLLVNGAPKQAPIFLVILCAMAAFGYLFWKQNYRDLADEVDDCGDYLLVRKQGEEDTVPLSNITNVNFSVDRRGTNARITLTLDSPGRFGSQIAFKPPPHIYVSPSPRNEVAEDLLARAHKARSGHSD